ncbi:DUF4230 domain-containing protein [Butyrivibrio sp. FCS014]|uniref:DUF4230 domain-containing protein n=1 Tax=Butyrivibrio sp. FCS014 TaxID=1408304 RepID=UPI000463EBE0|nr:DUF4230 domain-containing protein [Butyrivibrio sp. FCS014]
MNELKKPQNIVYLAVIGAAFLLSLILCLTFISKREPASDEAAETATVVKKEDKVLVTVNVETVEDGLRDMGTLITQEYYFSQVEKYTKSKKIAWVFDSTSEIAYGYDGTVTAGIDFTKIELEKDEENKTVKVTIPPSEIQNVDIDTSSFRVYSEKDSLWNPMKLEDYNLSLQEFEKAAEKKALDSGILERSDEQAKLLINGFIRNYSALSDYDIEMEVKR